MIKLVETKKEVEDIKEMVRKSFYETIFKGLKLDDDQIDNFLTAYFNDSRKVVCLISYKDGSPTGFIIGVSGNIPFTSTVLATELAWYCEDKKQLIHLFESFEYWGREIAKADVLQTGLLVKENPETLDKFFTRRGYEEMERVYRKDIS